MGGIGNHLKGQLTLTACSRSAHRESREDGSKESRDRKLCFGSMFVPTHWEGVKCEHGVTGLEETAYLRDADWLRKNLVLDGSDAIGRGLWGALANVLLARSGQLVP